MLSICPKIMKSPSVSLSAAMIIVGSSVICGKTISQDFPLFLASEIRFLIAVGCFLPLKTYHREFFRLPLHDWMLLTAMAFCGQILFTLLLLLGLRYTSGMNAGTLSSTTPFFMALFSFFVLKERLGLQQFTGLFFSLLTIFLLNFSTFCLAETNNSQQWLGNLYILSAVASEAVFLLLGKKLHTPISCQAITALLCLLGVVFCLPPALYEAMHFNFLSLTATDVVAMLYFGIIYTDIAYLLWFRGAARCSGISASAFTALMPLSASLLSAILLYEPISCWQAGALASAITSILLLTL